MHVLRWLDTPVCYNCYLIDRLRFILKYVFTHMRPIFDINFLLIFNIWHVDINQFIYYIYFSSALAYNYTYSCQFLAPGVQIKSSLSLQYLHMYFMLYMYNWVSICNFDITESSTIETLFHLQIKHRLIQHYEHLYINW